MSVEQRFVVHNEIQLDKKKPRQTRYWMKRKLGMNHERGTRTTSCSDKSYMVVCLGLPQNLRVGDHFQFEIHIQPDSGNDVEDEITIEYCILTLTAQAGGDNPSAVELEILRQKKNTQKLSGTFSKDSGYKKTVDLGVISHIPATFNGQDANPSYKARVEIRLNVGNKPGASNSIDINYYCGLSLHPLVSRTAIPEPTVRLPTYNEVMAG